MQIKNPSQLELLLNLNPKNVIETIRHTAELKLPEKFAP